MKYKPRNDFVIIRSELVTVNKAGIALPETSETSKKFWVEAVGPDVIDLKPGDQVVPAVDVRTECVHGIPGEKDLVVLKQAYIGVKVGK